MMKLTSLKKGMEAEVATIGFAVVSARVATWSVMLGELGRPRVADGIGTSSTSPLEVPLVCKGSIEAVQLVSRQCEA